MAFKYTVVTDTLPWIGYNVLEQPQDVLRTVKEAGYDGIDLPGDPSRMDGSEWRKMTEDAGLEVPELLGAWGYYHAGKERNLASPDQAQRGDAVQYAKDTVDLAAEIGATFVQLCAAQPAVPQLPYPEEDISTLRTQFKRSIREICEHASQCGVSILLEPLNCYEGFPGVLTTVIEAVNYVEELGLSNLGIQPDNYHMNISESSIEAAVRVAGKYIRHYHCNETNHAVQGTGHADYQEIVRILKGIGYDDYIAFYMPHTSQQICRSAPGVGYGKSDPTSTGDATGKKPLLEYLSQPLRLLKEIEQAVDTEREFYELDRPRY